MHASVKIQTVECICMGSIGRITYFLMVAVRMMHLLGVHCAIEHRSRFAAIPAGNEAQSRYVLLLVDGYLVGKLLSAAIVHLCQGYVLAELNTEAHLFQTIRMNGSIVVETEMLHGLVELLLTLFLAVVDGSLVAVTAG